MPRYILAAATLCLLGCQPKVLVTLSDGRLRSDDSLLRRRFVVYENGAVHFTETLLPEEQRVPPTARWQVPANRLDAIKAALEPVRAMPGGRVQCSMRVMPGVPVGTSVEFSGEGGPVMVQVPGNCGNPPQALENLWTAIRETQPR